MNKIEFLVTMLKATTDAEARNDVVGTLTQSLENYKDGEKYLLPLLQSENSVIRKIAVTLLSKYSNIEEYLIPLLSDKDEYVHACVFKELVKRMDINTLLKQDLSKEDRMFLTQKAKGMIIRTLDDLEKIAKRNYKDKSLSVSKYYVLNVLVEYHFAYDKGDDINKYMSVPIDFRCLTPDMVDEDGYLKKEYIVLMFYQGGFGGVIVETDDSTNVYYINEYMARVFLGYIATLYTDEVGVYLNEETLTEINNFF